MITIISGTDRKDSMTLKVSKIVETSYREQGVDCQICDLAQLPPGLFRPEHYGQPPPEFRPFQDMILDTQGILVVLPEYNGGMPGALKYFIDPLKFPESLQDMPCCFVGVAAGRFGALRPIEQVEMVFQYRQAHLYGKRAMFMNVEEKLNSQGTAITDEETAQILRETLQGFAQFVQKLSGP